MHKQWISIHIFYYGDQNYLLVNCIAPLIDDLRAQGLLRRYFFIKYWLEGPHIRLRILPMQITDETRIKVLAEEAITRFLQEHPAFFMPTKQWAAIPKMMFLQEYGEEEWNRRYAALGEIPTRPNNTFAYIPYEAEYVRYGGIDGVELAEWHFEHSSDIVLRLLREINVTVPSILLGMSVQLSLPFFYGLFDEDQRVMRALEYYIQFWQSTTSKTSSATIRTQNALLQKNYRRMAPGLLPRISYIREHMLEGDTQGKLTSIEQTWKEHIRELRQRINTLFAEKRLQVERGASWGDIDDFTMVTHYLQGSYVHMTNNRLGISIQQEVYLAQLMRMTLAEITSRPREEVR